MSVSEKQGAHLDDLRAIAGSISGKLVAVAGARYAAARAHTAVAIYQLPKAKHHASAVVGASVTVLAFAADDLLIVGCDDGRLLGLDAGADKPSVLFEQEMFSGAVSLLRADGAGKQLVAGAASGEMALLSLEATAPPALKVLGRRSLSGRALTAAAFSNDQRTLVVGGEDGLLRVWTDGVLQDLPEPREVALGEGGIAALALTGDGRVVAGCGDGSVRLAYLQGALDEEDRSRDDAHSDALTGLALGPSLLDEHNKPRPRALFSCGRDGKLRRWELDSRRKPAVTDEGARRLVGMCWLPATSRKTERSGGMLAYISDDRRLMVQALDERTRAGGDTLRVVSDWARLGRDLKARARDTRLAAVAELGKLPETEARTLLERALRDDGHEDVRALAAKTLGETGRVHSRNALVTALDDRFEAVRRAALAALLKLAGDSPVEALRAALGSTHADIRIAAIKQLPAHRDRSPAVVGLIAGRLSDDDRKAREAALDALCATEPEGALAPLRTALARGPADVRRLSLLRLGRSKKATAIEGAQLLESAFGDEESSVRLTALDVALAARPRIAARLGQLDADLAKRFARLTSRGAFSDASAEGDLDEDDRAPLFAAMAARAGDLALRGATLLATLGDARGSGALLQLSREEDASMRRKVVDALQRAAYALPADDRVTARLQWLLDDSDSGVRLAAYQALAALAELEGPSGLFATATLGLRSAQQDIRAHALQLLVQFGGSGKHAGASLQERADELLGEALDDEAAQVRDEALRTLWAWHPKRPEAVLTRAAAARQASIRKTAVRQLAERYDSKRGKKSKPAAWIESLLLQLCADASADVGSAAYKALTQQDATKKRADIHLAALASPRIAVRAEACRGSHRAEPTAALLKRLRALVEDDAPSVHQAAITAIDRHWPDEQEAFRRAFASIFYELRVVAGELCGKRRDVRAVVPMQELLSIPATHINRPSDALRSRAARALADVGHAGSIPFLVALLEDDDGHVRESGARGLMLACQPGSEQPLVDALAHGDLAVRSWAAEGLARLGDRRALPVLIGTLAHAHNPLRHGAVVGLAALGGEGVGGLLRGLEDDDRAFQELALAIVVARDIAMARAKLPPDLLLTALSARHPELRYAAARALQSRDSGLSALAHELVGPRKPDKSGDMKSWPKEDDRAQLLELLIRLLASDHPYKRYAAARVLVLRPQPKAFWREAKRLQDPAAARIPFTNWDDEAREQAKPGELRKAAQAEPEPGATRTPSLVAVGPTRSAWLMPMFRGRPQPRAASGTEQLLSVLRNRGAHPPRALPASHDFHWNDVQRDQLLFGTYVGLVRQAPPEGEADATHRVRRDALARLAELAQHDNIGRAAVLPVMRRALSDPHHLVRKSALAALRGLYPDGALQPLVLALSSHAADVGREAVEGIFAAAQADNQEARALIAETLHAVAPAVRRFALGRLPRLYEEGSAEPWMLALASRYADVRLAVVDRLAGSTSEEVGAALARALESDHADLRMAAATQLARRGDVRAVGVLLAFVLGQDESAAARAHERLVEGVQAAQAAGRGEAITEAAARGFAELLADEERNRREVVYALSSLRSAVADEALIKLLSGDDASLADDAFDALEAIALDRTQKPIRMREGPDRLRYQEPLALRYAAAAAATSVHADLRRRATELLLHLDDPAADGWLSRLATDRDEQVRIAAAQLLALRTEQLKAAPSDSLLRLLRGGRRELVLPLARGLAVRRERAAFQPLLLVLKAGQDDERERALVALGQLGDDRALDELLPLANPDTELEERDQQLRAPAAEALAAMLPSIEDPERKREATDLIERLLATAPTEIRSRILTGLRRAGDDVSRARIEAVAANRYIDEDLRSDAIEQLGILAHQDSEATLVAVVREQHWLLSDSAVDALHELFPNDPTRVYMHMLRSKNDDLEARAAGYLAQHGEAEPLLAQLATITSRHVRRRLRRGLVRRGQPPLAPLSELLTGEDAGPRADAAWIAGAIDPQREGADALRKALGKAVKQAAEQWQQPEASRARKRQRGEAWLATLWACRRLGVKADAQARAALTSADAPVAVRLEAVRLLTSSGDEKPLLSALDDGEAVVRRSAAAALRKIAPGKAAKHLNKHAQADVLALRPLIDEAMTGKPDLLADEKLREAALPAMVAGEQLDAFEAATKAKGPARLLAIHALGRMGNSRTEGHGERAEAILKNILEQDGSADAVRAAAFKALRRLQRVLVRKQAHAGQHRAVMGYRTGYIPPLPDYDLNEHADEYDDEI